MKMAQGPRIALTDQDHEETGVSNGNGYPQMKEEAFLPAWD